MLGKNTSFALMLTTLTVISVKDVGAQAYIQQVSPGDKQAYVEQTPATARPTETPPPSSKRTASLAGKARQKASRANYNPFPSVGKGSTAIVQAEGDATEWPTVGRGAVNR